MWFARLWSPLANIVSRQTGSALWYTTDSLHARRYSPRISGEKAAAELGYKPRPLRETVEDTLEWFEAHGYPTDAQGDP
jgi:dihydroflavonol-4-reductase